ARPLGGALRVEERVAPRQVEVDARGQRRANRVPNLPGVRRGAEARLAGRIDRRERAVPVLRDVGAALRRVVRADPELRELAVELRERGRDRAILRRVALDREE